MLLNNNNTELLKKKKKLHMAGLEPGTFEFPTLREIYLNFSFFLGEILL